MGFLGKQIVSVDDLDDGFISRLFFCARKFKNNGLALEKHKDAVLMTAFFEPSTRTRLSFEMAAHRLGIKISTFHAPSSSMLKGESEIESINNLTALRPDILVIRQATPFNKALLEPHHGVIINGGDGINEHPTQALLDSFTLLDFYSADSFLGKKILIVGDIAHSRVAHSNIKLMSRLGANITLLAPAIFLPTDSIGQKAMLNSFDEVDFEVNAIMCLRVQKERLKKGIELTDSEFSNKYGLTMDRLQRLGKDCVVLHPGPINFGVEMDNEILNHPRSLVRRQVENGVFVRAALMDLCLTFREQSI